MIFTVLYLLIKIPDLKVNGVIFPKKTLDLSKRRYSFYGLPFFSEHRLFREDGTKVGIYLSRFHIQKHAFN